MKNTFQIYSKEMTQSNNMFKYSKSDAGLAVK